MPVEVSKKNMKWRERPSRTFKYVDHIHNIRADPLCMETEVGPYRDRHAVACQNGF